MTVPTLSLSRYRKDPAIHKKPGQSGGSLSYTSNTNRSPICWHSPVHICHRYTYGPHIPCRCLHTHHIHFPHTHTLYIHTPYTSPLFTHTPDIHAKTHLPSHHTYATDTHTYYHTCHTYLPIHHIAYMSHTYLQHTTYSTQAAYIHTTHIHTSTLNM